MCVQCVCKFSFFLVVYNIESPIHLFGTASLQTGFSNEFPAVILFDAVTQTCDGEYLTESNWDFIHRLRDHRICIMLECWNYTM